MSYTTALKLGLKNHIVPFSARKSVRTAKSGTSLNIIGTTKPPVTITFFDQNGKRIQFRTKFVVIKGLSMQINIAGPFLADNGIDHLHSRGLLKMGFHTFQLYNNIHCRGFNAHRQLFISVIEDAESHGIDLYSPDVEVTIPPFEGCRLPLQPRDTSTPMIAGATEFHFSPHFLRKHHLNSDITDQDNVLVSHQPQLVDIDENQSTSVLLINTTKDPIKIGAKSHVGYVAPICEEMQVIASVPDEDVNDVPPSREPWESNDSSSSLSKDQRKKREQWIITEFAFKDNELIKDVQQGAGQQLLRLLMNQWPVIRRDNNAGLTNMAEHAILTPKGVKPVKKKNYVINPVAAEDLKKQIQTWLKDGVVEESQPSPWNFPIHPVLKKNGRLRWVIDLRALNKITRADSYPIPNINELIDHLRGSCFFSAIDISAAFHCIPVRKIDQEKLSFSSGQRHFRFVRMPFGAINAPSTWARLITKVLEDFPKSKCLVFFDDLLVHSADLNQHFEILNEVLTALNHAGLKITADKCHMVRTEIEYLGQYITPEGVTVPRRFTSIIDDWPLPETLKELRSFMGKASYYRKYIKDFSKISSALLTHLKGEKDSKRKLELDKDPEAIISFNKLKKALASPNVLTYPDFHSDCPFILDTDFSSGGIGVVLSQVQNGEERPISFGARRLTPGETHYSSFKGEMCAVIYGIESHKYYLLGRKFLVRVDNNAVTWLKTQKDPRGILTRWLRILAAYDFNIVHRNSKQHANADSLSRAKHAPVMTAKEIQELKLDESICVLDSDENTPEDFERMKYEQESDPDISKVRRWVLLQTKPTGADYKMLTYEQKRYADVIEQLALVNDVLMRKTTNPLNQQLTYRVCLPQSLQKEYTKRIHDLAHMGETTVIGYVEQRYYFPRLTTVVKNVVHSCQRCQQLKQKQPQRHTFEADLAGYPGEKWAIDFVGPMHSTSRGHTSLFTCLDVFTRWFECFPVKDQTAKTAISLITERIIPWHGFPTTVLSDNGPSFVSEVFNEVLSRFDIRAVKCPIYNPKSNSVERYHRTMGRRLRALLHEYGRDWDQHVPAVLLSIRTSRNRSTGFTPFFLERGREARLPIDIGLGYSPIDRVSTGDYADRLFDTFQSAYRDVTNVQREYVDRQRQLYNEREKRIKVGDLVWLYTPRPKLGVSRKFQNFWSGPFKVISQISNVLFRIKTHGSWSTEDIETVVAVDRIKKCILENPEINLSIPIELTAEDLLVDDEGAERLGIDLEELSPYIRPVDGDLTKELIQPPRAKQTIAPKSSTNKFHPNENIPHSANAQDKGAKNPNGSTNDDPKRVESSSEDQNKFPQFIQQTGFTQTSTPIKVISDKKQNVTFDTQRDEFSGNDSTIFHPQQETIHEDPIPVVEDPSASTGPPMAEEDPPQKTRRKSKLIPTWKVCSECLMSAPSRCLDHCSSCTKSRRCPLHRPIPGCSKCTHTRRCKEHSKV